MKPFFFILALFIALSVPAQSQNVSFVAKAQQAVVEGGKFQLVYTLDSEGSDIRLPALDDFQILMGPSTSYSNSTSIINGRVSREVNYTYTYILKALKVGNYTIPGATIMVDDKKYQSNALSIEVIKSDAGSSNGGGSNSATQYDDANESSSSADVTSSEDLFITVTPSKRDLYQGESLVLTTKIYTKVQLEGLSDIKKPSMSEFIQQELKTSEGISWSLENVNGKTYNVGVYEQTLVFPQKSGRLTIDPTDIEFMVRQRATRRSRSIFDEFFESGYKVTKQRVKSKPIVLNVKPFAGVKPDGFSGGVGSFNLNASVSKSDVVVNDAITMKIDVSGTGNLKFIDEPKVSFPADFESFDVKINNNINATSNGLSGTKTFEYTIIPRYAGEFTIPAINFSYFDAAAGRFITLTKGPFVINVGKGNGSNQANLVGAVRSNVNRENVKYLGKDIRHIKSKVEHLKPKGSFFLGSMMFYFSLILPGLLFLLLYMLNRKRILDNSNISLSKHKGANKLAVKRLKQADHLLKQGNKEAFYEEVLRAFWGYMSDKLSLPLSQLSKDNISDILSKNKVDEKYIHQVMEILDTCEFARYAPASGSDEMDKIYNQAIDTIGKLENNIKRIK